MKQKDIDSQILDLKAKLDSKNLYINQLKQEYDKNIDEMIREKLEMNLELEKLNRNGGGKGNGSNYSQFKNNKNDKIIDDFLLENEEINKINTDNLPFK